MQRNERRPNSVVFVGQGAWRSRGEDSTVPGRRGREGSMGMLCWPWGGVVQAEEEGRALQTEGTA